MRSIYLPKLAGLLLLSLLFATSLPAQKKLATKKTAATEITQFKEVLPSIVKVLAPGETCDEAVAIGPGLTTVDSVNTGFGAILTNADHAKWYTYTPENDAIVTVTSCQITDTDTRVAIFTGPDCMLGNLTEIALNDDCEPDIDNYASEVTFFAEAGVRYFVYWDDRWSGDGFDFELIEGSTAVNVTFEVDMSEETVSGDGVGMVYAGPGTTDVGDVNIVALEDMDGDGIYTTTLPLTSQDTIGYAFLNGALAVDNVEAVPNACGLENAFGFNIRPLIITELADFTLPLVCFGSCEPCTIVVEDCGEPFALIEDGFETYSLGLISDQSPNWAPFGFNDPMAEDATVTDEQAFEGGQSLLISGADSDDMILRLGNRNSGHFLLSWEMYVPEDSVAYYTLYDDQDDLSVGDGFQVLFNADGTVDLFDEDPGSLSFDYPQDDWFTVIHIINLDEDLITLVIDNEIKYSWSLSQGVFGGADGFAELGAMNFYGLDDETKFFLDDVKLWAIPPAGSGQYCYTAEEIGLGTHTVSSIDCFGGYYDRGFFSSGTVVRGESGYWYQYTAESDGILSISSCGGGADTRGWILQGTECTGAPLEVWGVNDDLCDLGDGDEFASYREAIVSAGETYYILWDNIWERTGFDWELALSTEEPLAGDFCQSAIEVEPGEYFVEEITGNAVVSSGIIAAGRPAAPYGESIWYSYTPDADGMATISSCLGAASDTRVAVYTGECGGSLFSLDLVAGNDDFDCGIDGLQSFIDSLEMTAGTTYYIEWMDMWEDAAFAWTLDYETTVSTDEATLAQGFKLFPNPVNEQLQVRFDFPESVDNLRLQLVNTLGQTVEQRYLGNVQRDHLTLNVSRLPAGVYLLQIASGESQVTRTVVVE